MNTNTTPAPAAMQAEQAADLLALQSAAAGEIDPLAPPAPPPVDLAGELAGVVSMVVQMLGPAWPSLQRIYTDQTIGAATGSIAAVCRKHGWLQGGVMGGWGEEIACAAMLIPLGITTVNGIKADNAARDKQRPAAAPAELEGEGSKSVTFGGVVAGGAA